METFGNPLIDFGRVPSDSADSQAQGFRKFVFFHQVVDVRAFEPGLGFNIGTAQDAPLGRGEMFDGHGDNSLVLGNVRNLFAVNRLWPGESSNNRIVPMTGFIGIPIDYSCVLEKIKPVLSRNPFRKCQQEGIETFCRNGDKKSRQEKTIDVLIFFNETLPNSDTGCLNPSWSRRRFMSAGRRKLSDL
jgi:hypothetical protein